MKSLSLIAVLFLLFGATVFADWPRAEYTEIRAYAYNLDGRSRQHSILVAGKLHPTVVNPDGVLLTKAQEAKLIAAINGKHPTHPVASCFIPRHAFIFYHHRKVVASVDICFECLVSDSTPAGISQPNDLPALDELCDELKLTKSPGP